MALAADQLCQHVALPNCAACLFCQAAKLRCASSNLQCLVPCLIPYCRSRERKVERIMGLQSEVEALRK